MRIVNFSQINLGRKFGRDRRPVPAHGLDTGVKTDVLDVLTATELDSDVVFDVIDVSDVNDVSASF